MPSTDEELLLAAQEHLQAMTTLALRERNWDVYRTALHALLSLEREIAQAKGDPYAIPLQFPVQWDTGAPLPHLIRNDHRTFLIFYVRQIDPHWDGTYVKVRCPSDNEPEPIAVVEFTRCLSAKLGAPNDEVLHGHPLHGKGLEAYTAQIVKNSPWIAEIQAINQVHSQYNPDNWRNYNHYVFWFHDTSFECIAETFAVELFETTLAEVLTHVCERIIRY